MASKDSLKRDKALILAVTEYYHDYQPKHYFIDSDKLNKSNSVEALILKSIKNKKKFIDVTYDASEDDDEEPGVTHNNCIVKEKDVTTIDKILTLRIDFDC